MLIYQVASCRSVHDQQQQLQPPQQQRQSQQQNQQQLLKVAINALTPPRTIITTSSQQGVCESVCVSERERDVREMTVTDSLLSLAVFHIVG